MNRFLIQMEMPYSGKNAIKDIFTKKKSEHQDLRHEGIG